MLTWGVLKNVNQVVQRVVFLHEDLMKLPSFPRKALEAELDLYANGEMGKVSIAGDVAPRLSFPVSLLNTKSYERALYFQLSLFFLVGMRHIYFFPKREKSLTLIRNFPVGWRSANFLFVFRNFMVWTFSTNSTGFA